VPTLLLTNTGEDLYEATQRSRDLRPDFFAYQALQGGTHDIIDEQPGPGWRRSPSSCASRRAECGPTQAGQAMKLTFLGAAREVTGSCVLVETDRVRFLVDCGMFQGGREAPARNRRRSSSIPPRSTSCC
jgi:hypothetical protein